MAVPPSITPEAETERPETERPTLIHERPESTEDENAPGISLPVQWVEAHWEERGFNDEEWAAFLKVRALVVCANVL